MGVTCWTDYPLADSDVPGAPAPVREVELIDWDRDKYATVLFDGREFEFKAGYLYAREGRYGTVPCVPREALEAVARGDFGAANTAIATARPARVSHGREDVAALVNAAAEALLAAEGAVAALEARGVAEDGPALAAATSSIKALEGVVLSNARHLGVTLTAPQRTLLMASAKAHPSCLGPLTPGQKVAARALERKGVLELDDYNADFVSPSKMGEALVAALATAARRVARRNAASRNDEHAIDRSAARPPATEHHTTGHEADEERPVAPPPAP